MANGSDPTPSSTSLKTFLVCGMTGAGKSTFINAVTGAHLSVSDRIDSDTVDVIESGIPLIKVGNEYIQLVDTPGFGDSREDDEVVILERITTWLVARYMSKVPVTGVIFLRPITEVRVNRLEKSLMMMFKDLCGENSLDHIFLLTSRWPSEASDKYEGRERDILSRDDMFGSNGDKQVQVRRLKDAYTPEDARHVVESCAGLASVTFQIQQEISDEKKSLAETQAGMRIGADWDQKLSGLEEQAKQASEYADAEKRRLEEAEAAKRRLDEEAAKAAEEARRLAEAEKEAQRQAEIAKARMEKERLEAEARARKAEADMRAAQKAAEEARALHEKQRAEEERRMQQARAEAEAARQRAERAAAEAARLREAEQRARWEREQQQQHQGGCLVM